MSDQGPAVVDAHDELEPCFADGFWRTAALFGVLGFVLGFLFAWLLFSLGGDDEGTPADVVVDVPSVEGLDVIAAVNALREVGFLVNPSQVEEASEEIEEGKVIRTEPAADQLAAVGSQVSIVVSTGLPTVTVPAVTDLFADTAIQTLRNELLDVAVIFEQVPAGSPSDGRVMAQDPAPFEEVEVGLVVTITVGQAAPETTTPTTTTPPTTTPPTTTYPTTPPTTTADGD